MKKNKLNLAPKQMVMVFLAALVVLCVAGMMLGGHAKAATKTNGGNSSVRVAVPGQVKGDDDSAWG